MSRRDPKRAGEVDPMSKATAQLFDLTSEREVEHQRHVRIVEAILFASAEPVSADDMQARLPPGADLGRILSELTLHYSYTPNLMGKVMKGMTRSQMEKGIGGLAASLKRESERVASGA